MSVNSDQLEKNNSVRSFLTALAVNGALLTIEVGLFVLLKTHLKRIYVPRTFLPPPGKRAAELPPGPWKWIFAILTTPAEEIIHKNGLDAYMTIRFFQMMMKICGVYLLVTWPILLPTNAVNINGETKDGLAQLAFGNIDKSQTSRYWAHLGVAYVLTFYTLWLIRREWLMLIKYRHEFLLSKQHARLAQSRTVLITNLPEELAGSEEDLKKLFSFVPGGIRKIWIYRNCPGLPELFEERQQLCLQLETAATDVMQLAVKASRKSAPTSSHIPSMPLTVHASEKDKELAADLEAVPSDQFIDNITRPTHRLGWFPFTGQKVDTIEYCSKEIARLTADIEKARETLVNCKPHGSAFVQCNLQMGAHVLAQCVSYHEPLFMAEKYTEVAVDDIIWANIDDGAYEVKLRWLLSWAATVGLLIVWAIPVAFAGATSNVDTLCNDYKWLAWVCHDTPPLVQGLIQGVFPPLLLAILFIILPFVLQALAWFECIPRHSFISVSVYKRYFLFLIIHGFLIITLSSGLTAAAGAKVGAAAAQAAGLAGNPQQVVENLAKYLPDANIFFLTYIIQQGLTGAASALLQAGPLIFFFIKRFFFGETPRDAYKATFLMPSTDLGIMLPRMSLLGAIAIAYSVIAPIINGLALVAFALFWLTWKFLFIWVMDQPDAQETSGLFFPLLVSNLFTGLYIKQLCMVGLFFLAQNDQDEQASLPQAVLMVILMAFTIYIHVFFNKNFGPVTEHLPMSLATHKLAEKFKKKEDDEKKDDIDLFSQDRVRNVVKTKLRLHSGHKASKQDKAKRQQEDAEKAAKKQAKKEKKKEIDPEKELHSPLDELHSPADIVGGKISSEPLLRQRTVESHHSKKSTKSDKQENKGTLTGLLAAARGHDMMLVESPTKALRGDDSDDDDDDLEEHAFDHPSTWQDQPWIWIPQWPENPQISAQLVNDLKAAGVDASDEGAHIDINGVVWVRRNPPDEDWSGGHDQ